ncbi:type IV secretory system conjugative DNA transfer family protein [Blautia wexlerae DSM 19850]|jgi:type IV secretion system protein VirD4|uniref:Type IV secretory system conjugative DNA transfer family protein n=2 Tax=Lachnospirales TaxID=3085636 RepID=A0A415UHZ4_9FIRM|nr:type IV secretory system conjugative DNA transfer family protein [Dorea formicigenerans]UWO22844.1 type IV secretory system conjugative DNA transfer family protein [Blautia wexlerae DSM 19850]
MEQLFMESAVRLAPIDTIRHGISSVAGIQCSIVAFILFGAVAGLIVWRGSGKEAYDERNFEVSSKGTYGTAGFMDEEERAQVLQSEKSFEKVDGVIFGRNLQDEKIISLPVESRLNRNFAVCGSQGSMKSRAFARVMALQCIRRGESVYLTDPKSELYEDLSFYFRESGYTVKQLNLIQLEHSDAWNCLGEIDDGSLIDVFCDVVIRNTTDKFDHFYDNTEMDLLKALCLYVFHEYPPEKRTFPEAYKLLINKSVDMLDAIFDRLPTHHPARGPYQLFAKAEKVKGNAVLGLGTRLQIMQNKLVQQITSHDEIDLSLPGREKCAYFCITSDQDSTFDMLATLFTSFLSIKLVRYADRTKERRLPVPVQFILDEFPNLGVVPDFKKKLATARSRGIGMSILFQNIPQLQNRYPDNQWEEILGGCDFSIFLGCNDMTTASYYSDRTGEITVSVSSIRKSYYTIRATDYVPEYTESTSLGKRMLLLPDEILRFPLDQGLLIIRGQKVCRFRKMDYLEHPDSQYMKLEKVEEHIPEWFKDWKQEKQNFKIYAEKEPDLPDKKEGGTEAGNPLTLDTEIKKTEKQANAKTSEQQEEKRIMKVEELFAFETSDGKEG